MMIIHNKIQYLIRMFTSKDYDDFMDNWGKVYLMIIQFKLKKYGS